MTATKPLSATVRLTPEWLADLEDGIAYFPPEGSTWTTGGVFDERPIAAVVASGRCGELVVACPYCRTPRSGKPLTHRHGASDEALEGIHGHRVGHGPGDCARLGYVVIDTRLEP